MSDAARAVASIAMRKAAGTADADDDGGGADGITYRAPSEFMAGYHGDGKAAGGSGV